MVTRLREDPAWIDRISAEMQQHASVLEASAELSPGISAAATIITGALREGGKLLLCGNGGSAADAQHLAAEFTGRFLRERRPYPAIALHANTSGLTAIGNDYGFEQVFARSVEAFGAAGDVLIAISTSGNSPNVIAAARLARARGLAVIGLTGADGGQLAAMCDRCLRVPSRDTPRIQELHILIGHIVCGLVEDALC